MFSYTSERQYSPILGAFPKVVRTFRGTSRENCYIAELTRGYDMLNAIEIHTRLNDLLDRGVIEQADLPYLADMHIQEILSKYPNFPTAPQRNGYWRFKLTQGSRGDRRIKSKTYIGLVRKLVAYESGTLGHASKTFEQFYHQIQNERLNGICDIDNKGSKESTIHRQDCSFQRYFAQTDLAAMRLDKITRNDIHRFLLMNLHRYPVVRSGFAEMKRILTLVLRKAYLREMIPANPCDRVEWDSDEYSNKLIGSASIRKRTYTDEEMDRLWDYEIDVIQQHPNFITSYAMLFQMQTGLRRGEICGLRWDDVTSDHNGNRYLSICRRLQRVPRRGNIPEQQHIVERTKTSKSRMLPIWPELAELLDAVHEISGNGRYIFPGDGEDGCLGYYAVYEHYQDVCHSTGIPIQKDTIRGPHAWRRNFAKRIGDSFISSHLLGNDQRVCEVNYSDAIDMDNARAIMEQRSLHKHLAIDFIKSGTLRKTA